MPKRFIDTEIFNDAWFMDLSVNAKLLYIYFITNCDHAGIIDINWKLAELQTGIKQLAKTYKTLTKEFTNRLIHLRNEYYFIPRFITFQYPNFPNSNVRQQSGAIKRLKEFDLFDEKKQTVIKELTNSYEYEDVTDNVIDNGNGYIKDENNFDFFWLKYHAITGKEKTDKESALKYWNKLKQHEKEKAIGNIQNYANTQENKLYLKKARTYLSDKNFNDEFNKTRETEFNDPIGRLEAVVNKKKYTP